MFDRDKTIISQLIPNEYSNIEVDVTTKFEVFEGQFI